MFQYIKQSFLPRDITILTGIAIGGGFSSGSGLQQLLCPQAIKGTLTLIFGVDVYQSTHSSSRNFMVLTSLPGNVSVLLKNITSFIYLPKGMPMSLFSNRLPFVTGLPYSFLPFLPSPPPLSFGCELAIH